MKILTQNSSIGEILAEAKKPATIDQCVEIVLALAFLEGLFKELREDEIRLGGLTAIEAVELKDRIHVAGSKLGDVVYAVRNGSAFIVSAAEAEGLINAAAQSADAEELPGIVEHIRQALTVPFERLSPAARQTVKDLRDSR